MSLSVTRVSVLSGKENTVVLPITQERYDLWLRSGRLIQDVFPELTPDQREFLLTGATKEEWDEAFKEED